MPVPPVLQSSRVTDVGLVAVWGVGIAACVSAAANDPTVNLRHPAVTGSAAITAAWMLTAWGAMLLGVNELARLAWSLGWLALLVHLGLAFGLGHGWSHAAAVEHVREVGGSGTGIAVNYLFALVWGADVVSWWVSGSPRMPLAIHGFLAFVVVNATVVFGPPERRLAYALALGLLVALWALRRKRREGHFFLRGSSSGLM